MTNRTYLQISLLRLPRPGLPDGHPPVEVLSLGHRRRVHKDGRLIFGAVGLVDHQLIRGDHLCGDVPVISTITTLSEKQQQKEKRN